MSWDNLIREYKNLHKLEFANNLYWEACFWVDPRVSTSCGITVGRHPISIYASYLTTRLVRGSKVKCCPIPDILPSKYASLEGPEHTLNHRRDDLFNWGDFRVLSRVGPNMIIGYRGYASISGGANWYLYWVYLVEHTYNYPQELTMLPSGLGTRILRHTVIAWPIV